MPIRKKATPRVTVAEIAAEGRPISKADLRHKLRELGGYAGIGEGDNFAEAIVEAAVAAEVEEIEQQELSPLATLMSHLPRAELAVALAFGAVVVVYRLGELTARRRGPQIEVSPLRWERQG